MADRNEISKALDGAIEKWVNIIDGNGIDKGSENCPLCILFNDDCGQCPVGSCDVYADWAIHYDNEHNFGELSGSRSVLCDECRRTAQDILSHLRKVKERFSSE